jgi:hypothetical protein
VVVTGQQGVELLGAVTSERRHLECRPPTITVVQVGVDCPLLPTNVPRLCPHPEHSLGDQAGAAFAGGKLVQHGEPVYAA